MDTGTIVLAFTRWGKLLRHSLLGIWLRHLQTFTGGYRVSLLLGAICATTAVCVAWHFSGQRQKKGRRALGPTTDPQHPVPLIPFYSTGSRPAAPSVTPAPPMRNTPPGGSTSPAPGYLL